MDKEGGGDADEGKEEEEEEEEDFMSDKFLVDTASTSAINSSSRGLTYTERRRRAVNASYDKGKTKSRAEREREARREGLKRDLIGDQTAMPVAGTGGAKRKADHDGAQTDSKALRMMMSMGFKPGQALGRADPSGGEPTVRTPIEVDERWLKPGARSGIGRLPKAAATAAVEKDIERAAATAAESEQAHATDGLALFRARARDSHGAGHAERLLSAARKTCETLDESELGMDYSPLWLDPATLSRKTEDLPAHVAELVRFALAGLDDMGQRGQADEADPGVASVLAPADAEAKQRRMERAHIARSFCLLPVEARLQITTSHLRRAHSYCLFCGHRYASEEEMQKECPGEEEDDH